MNKTDLIEYQKKLAQLAEDEIKQRNLYLKGLANGEIQGPTLEEKSVSMPWLKFFSDEEIMSEIPDGSIYEYIKNRNKENLDKVALVYYDKEI